MVLYTLRGCSACVRARLRLREREIEFTEVRGDSAGSFRRELMERTGRATVPQITVDGEPIGGFSDLARLDRKGVLDALVRHEEFPRAVPVRRLSAIGVLAFPFGGGCGPWRHEVELVDRTGRVTERQPVGSEEEAAWFAALLNDEQAPISA